MITIEHSIRAFYVIAIVVIIFTAKSLIGISEDHIITEIPDHYTVTSPTPMEMYQIIEEYADQYEVPRYIAYNIAYKETRYKGPFDWSYDPSLESYAGAVGPMQVMVPTAKFINHKDISKNRLKNDIRINIKTSMKLLRHLHDIYGNWAIVCGYYNTGQPIVNDYARYCVTHRDYRSVWVFYQKK